MLMYQDFNKLKKYFLPKVSPREQNFEKILLSTKMF